MENLFPPPSVPLAIPEDMGLPPLPKLLDAKRPIAWLGDDGSNVFIETQGSLACIAFRKGPLKYQRKPREEVRGFSAASRLRLFKMTNRLDFAKAGRSTFVTATWRDELGRPDSAEITRARSAFQKSIERMAGQELSGFWRTEWEVRQRGDFKGEYMPHVHTIYFNIPWLPIKEVEKAWARAINWRGEVSFKMNEIYSLRQCLAYVSWYIAKLDVMCRLDIPSYLATHVGGRKWGVYRKKLLPLAPMTLIRVPPGPLVDEIRRIATEAYARTPSGAEEGFCVFGDAAQEISRKVEAWCLQNVEGLVE